MKIETVIVVLMAICSAVLASPDDNVQKQSVPVVQTLNEPEQEQQQQGQPVDLPPEAQLDPEAKSPDGADLETANTFWGGYGGYGGYGGGYYRPNYYGGWRRGWGSGWGNGWGGRGYYGNGYRGWGGWGRGYGGWGGWNYWG